MKIVEVEERFLKFWFVAKRLQRSSTLEKCATEPAAELRFLMSVIREAYRCHREAYFEKWGFIVPL